MLTLNMHDAKSQLSKLVEAIESGSEDEIIIARNGKPAARLVALAPPKRKVRLGLAKGKFPPYNPDPELDKEIERLFYGEDT